MVDKKVGFAGILSVILACSVIANLLQLAAYFGIDARLDEKYDELHNTRALVHMASQAMDHDMRVRVVSQAKFEGNSRLIDHLSWEFVFDFPRYQDFKPDQESYLVRD